MLVPLNILVFLWPAKHFLNFFSCALNVGNYNGAVPVVIGRLIGGIVVIGTIVIISVSGVVYVVWNAS